MARRMKLIACSMGTVFRRGLIKERQRRAVTRKTRPIIIDKVGCNNASQVKEVSM